MDNFPENYECEGQIDIWEWMEEKEKQNMTKDSEEYKQFCAEYETKQKERRDNPDKYPYFAYYQFGFHRMTYLSEEEVKEEVKFYHLKSDCKGGYFRLGRQPISILPRKNESEGKQWQT